MHTPSASGGHTFIDMHVTMDGSLSLQEAHAATMVIEDAILNEISPADVTVHVEPAETVVVPNKKTRQKK